MAGASVDPGRRGFPWPFPAGKVPFLGKPGGAPCGLVIAGTRSGCGKTSVALGLMRALSRRGLAVQAFKVGPDFIDPGHHALATGRESHNLDDWMCGADGVRDIFLRYAQGADVVVVEGVMGLFDGFSATDETGSTARVAKLLQLPVLLVADAAAMARSAAALVKGYLDFDPGLRFCGVLLNNAASPSHAALLREGLAAALPNVPLWGVLPRCTAVAMPSRHLGLVTAGEDPAATAHLDALADWLEASCDLAAFFGKAVSGAARAFPTVALCPSPTPRPAVRIGLARDAAFCFYYAENLRRLEAAGARLIPFSPLADKALPDGLDGLYLGGGYPELYAAALAANGTMRQDILAFCAANRPVLAECGGFMYLLRALTDLHGREYPMAGVFPMRAVMGERFSALGYREATTVAETPFGPAGMRLRGHEFHYSRLEGDVSAVTAGYALTGRKGAIPGPGGFLFGRTLGSYVHVHFGSCPEAAVSFVDACAEAR